MYKKPKDNDKYQWTNHVIGKMIYYRISESLVKRVTRYPQRREWGIAPGTMACMQKAGSKKRPNEIWVMYEEIGHRPTSNFQPSTTNHRLRIISAWRYPGVSKIGEPIPIPAEIRDELTGMF